jgi:response regulator RpfG family c-di-GMP phosphodiesterase
MSVEVTLESAKQLRSKGLFQAAIDALHQLVEGIPGDGDSGQLGSIYHELGVLYYHMADFQQSVVYFTRAIEHTTNRDDWVKRNTVLAAAYHRLSEFDTCYRILSELKRYIDVVSPETKGLFWLNLSGIEGIYGFYTQAIASSQQSFLAYAVDNIHRNDVVLNNNLGVFYLEMGHYDQAEQYLMNAYKMSQGKDISILSDLGRLYMSKGEMARSVEYAKRALSVIWSSIIAYEKEQIARLCHLLANIAIRLGESELAFQLYEKAQVLFGQLAMWRQWQDIESEVSRWTDSPPPLADDETGTISLDEVQHFLQYLDAINSQELIHKQVMRLLDLRSHYAELVAEELGLSEAEQRDLALASRFADYGWTALENEVVLNPRRSEQAFEKYKLHPSLSVRMAQSLGLSHGITNIIQDHHECYDGSGYPNGKTANDIDYLARVLAVVDRYCTGIVLEGKNHFSALSEIVEQSGAHFDPNVVQAFVRMHVVP